MKTSLRVAIFAGVILSAITLIEAKACEINLYKKTLRSKTSYLLETVNGASKLVSVSARIQGSLRKQCALKFKMVPVSIRRDLLQAKYARDLKKIGGE